MEKAGKIVIIGGVAAGASAAARARRLNEDASITVIERSPYVSFANCGMPYHIGGEIPDRQKLLLNSPEFFKRRFNIDVLVNHEAVSINRDSKRVFVRDVIAGREFEIEYDSLLLANGAFHIVPPVDGIDAENVFPLRHMTHMDRIKEYIDSHAPREAVILGAGFIGIELAEQLKKLNVSVTVVEKLDQILPPFDYEMASIVEEHLVSSGVRVIKGDGAVKIVRDGNFAAGIVLDSGTEIKCDIILLCVGVRPDTAIAVSAGLKTGATGAIAVDKRMCTSDGSIYAAGDVAESVHRVTGKNVWMPLAGPANFQGRVAGSVMAGHDAEFSGVLGTAIVRANRITAAKTGLSEKEAAREGLDFFVSYSHSSSHAGYYPGASMQHIKLTVEKGTGRLLGAQAAGYDRVDKTIDIFASIIGLGGTIDDLVELDLAYAPPFSSAKSPVQMAGMIAQNRLLGIDEAIGAEDVIKSGYRVIDVRTPSEHQNDAIFEGSELIPIDSLRGNMPVAGEGEKIALLCRAGLRSYLGYRILTQKGYEDVKNINGGFLMSRHILKKG